MVNLYLLQKRLDELEEKMKSFATRIRKDQCLDLKPKVRSKRYIELEGDGKKIYERLKHHALAIVQDINSAGQILTDPIAMRAFNDALNPDEQIRLLMGKKVGNGVPGVLGIGRRYFKGRDIQTAANILKSPSVVGRLGLTQ